MVVWQGITSEGTAVPVQITDDGKVVAVGETGPQGPKGDTGPQGPKGDTGPAGTVEWPPFPFEGAFLCWIGGEAVWYSANPPIPITPGVTPPIADVQENSALEFNYPVDLETFVKGAVLESCDKDGVWLKGPAGTDYSQIWTPYLTVNGGFATPPENLFIQGASQGVVANDPTEPIRMDISLLGQPGGRVRLAGTITGAGKIRFRVFGSNGTREIVQNLSNVGPFEIRVDESENPTSWECETLTAQGVALTGTSVNGITPLNGPLCSGTITAAGNNYILLKDVSGTWLPEMYGKTKPLRIAPWRMAQIRRANKVTEDR